MNKKIVVIFLLFVMLVSSTTLFFGSTTVHADMESGGEGYNMDISEGYFSWPLKGKYSLTNTINATQEELNQGERGFAFLYETRNLDGWEFHDALDIWCPEGTKVYAAAGGTVLEASYGDDEPTVHADCDDNPTLLQLGLNGNHIIIKHDNGFCTIYDHLSSFKVKKGQKVTKGQLIGLSGHTGRCIGEPGTSNPDGDHLHFAITAGSGRGAYYKDSYAGGPYEIFKYHYGTTNPCYYFGPELIEYANKYYEENPDSHSDFVFQGDILITADQIWNFPDPDNPTASGSDSGGRNPENARRGFIQALKEIADNPSYDYNSLSYGGHGGCSAYVSMALWKAGIIEEGEIFIAGCVAGVRGDIGLPEALKNNGKGCLGDTSRFTEIKNIDEIQDGDIIIRSGNIGHVGVYYQNGTFEGTPSTHGAYPRDIAFIDECYAAACGGGFFAAYRIIGDGEYQEDIELPDPLTPDDPLYYTLPRDEGYLQGMDFMGNYIYGEMPLLTLPDKDGLSPEEVYNISYIQDTVKSNSGGIMKYVNIVMSIAGYALITYGILLILAMLFDNVNTIFNISLVYIFTLGRLYYVPKREENSVNRDEYNIVTTKDVLIRAGIIIGIGLLAVSGLVVKFIIFVISGLKSLFS